MYYQNEVNDYQSVLGYFQTVNENTQTGEKMQFYIEEKVGFMTRKLNSRELTPDLQTMDRDRDSSRAPYRE